MTRRWVYLTKDTEAIAFEQEARMFLLAWRQVGARRDEHAKVCSLCWPLLSESQRWAAVANGSRLYAKLTRTLPEFGHHSIQVQATPNDFCANATEFRPEFARITHECKPQLSRFRSTFLTNATNTARIPRTCNLILCRLRPTYIHMQHKLVPNSVKTPSTWNPNRPNFMPTSVVERHTKIGRVWR